MRNALTYARDFDALIVHHVEDDDLAHGGVMNEGETATRLGLAGVPREAETIMLDRDIRIARMTGGRYHAAQISCEPAVAALRRAKLAGSGVTAGAAIAHLALNENDVGAYRTFFKMSPPLRSEDDRQALVEALADGTIDVICSAHDPQDVEGKRQPFAEAADGAVGLETMLAAGLRLVHSGDVPLLRLIDAMSTAPAKLLGLEAGTLAPGAPADLIVVNLDLPWIVKEEELQLALKEHGLRRRAHDRQGHAHHGRRQHSLRIRRLRQPRSRTARRPGRASIRSRRARPIVPAHSPAPTPEFPGGRAQDQLPLRRRRDRAP